MNDFLVRKYLEKIMLNDRRDYYIEFTSKEYIDIIEEICRYYIVNEYTKEVIRKKFNIVIDRDLDSILFKMEKAGIFTKKVETKRHRSNTRYEMSSEFNKIICKLNKINVFNNSEEVAKRCKKSSNTEDILYDVEKIISNKSKFIQYMKHL